MKYFKMAVMLPNLLQFVKKEGLNELIFPSMERYCEVSLNIHSSAPTPASITARPFSCKK
jgi:hypothetical protein